MTLLRRALAVAGVLAVSAAGLCAVRAAEAAASTIAWQACPEYSDEAMGVLGIPADRVADFRKLWARTECGTLQVPLDYAHPGGGTVTVAVTRLKATDQAHRSGSIALNPGGPGGSGYLMGVDVVLRSTAFATLNARYDLIGFDPRGVGYSTRAECARGEDTGGPPAPGPVTEEAARQQYADTVRANEACFASNAAFLRQLTTANVARDLNRIRLALGLRTIDYFGASWGTLLGAVYRSMYPDTVGRMWLDSMLGPDTNRIDARFADITRATEATVARQAAWIAARAATYKLGGTAGEVVATIRRMKAALDATPIRFSDADITLDGNFIAFLASSPDRYRADAAAALTEMLTARAGEPAPPTVAAIISPPPSGPPPSTPPEDLPQLMNTVLNQAILCNDDSGARDFETYWIGYQRLLREYPVTASMQQPINLCAGWPQLANRPFPLRRDDGSLQMSGHRYETLAPYPWIWRMRSAIGGTVFTVDDDEHGSTAFVAGCAGHVAAYFTTGRPDGGSCAGASADSPTSSLAATGNTGDSLRYPAK